MALSHDWVFTPRLRSFRFGRKATKHVRTLFDRFWLQAEVRRCRFNVRSWMNSGRWDVRYGADRFLSERWTGHTGFYKFTTDALGSGNQSSIPSHDQPLRGQRIRLLPVTAGCEQAICPHVRFPLH